jgi:uncharacterized protein (TIGR00730 family)
MKAISSLCVFCGSSSGQDPRFSQHTSEFGTFLAQAGIRVVYGGGHVGLMGTLADAALAAGGEVVGVIPQKLVERELAHATLTKLHVVTTMHERKALMASLSDGFVALPGGLGTLEEFFEVWTWAQLGYHDKPLALLDVDGYFAPLLAFLEHAVEQRFIAEGELNRVTHAASAERLLAGMRESANTVRIYTATQLR